ncbi:MAG: hypothetical protein EA394_06215 [Bacteroidia bacterium]|nr:MAG: hypothetical protein EA394_06215 [Bacteroidia bacterium]
MSFVFPGFLFALFAVSIPVIIHLFRFRRFRTVYFPNIAFLQQLSEASDKESRLKHLLVLLARILVITFLVMAFARPYIPFGEEEITGDGNAVGVYVDNSFSMNALSAQGRLLDLARNRALEIAAMYGPADRFLLLTNDFEGRHQRFVSREEFIDMVQEISESARVRSIADVMRRKSELFSEEPAGNKRAYYISDFQKSTTGLKDAIIDTVPFAYFIPLRASQTDNVFVDSVWFDSPVILAGQPVTMGIRIVNAGVQSLENQPLRVFVDGQQRSVVSYSIGPEDQTLVEVSWAAGMHELQQGHVEITDYPIDFDDKLYFSYRVTTEIPVMSLDGNGQSPYLRALYGGDELFAFQTMPSFAIDFSAFSEHSLMVMNHFNRVSAGLASALRSYVEEGGTLAIFPGQEIDRASYNDFLMNMGVDTYGRLDTTSIRVSVLNEMHAVFEGVFEHLPENVDLPGVSKHYAISRTIGSMGENILQLQNGLPFLASYPVGNGRVFLSAVPLDETFSNFPRHSLFVPVMANIALQSGYMQPPYHTIGDGKPVISRRRSAQTDQVYRLKRDQFEVIPEQRRSGNQVQLFFHDQISRSQNYALLLGDEQIGGLSFNYDRRESILDAYTERELQNLLADMQVTSVQVVDAGDKPLDQTLHEMAKGRQLWRLFVILALLFLLFEVLILRFWK